ncbi:probable uridine nucleosidase 2 isoform X2 [Panicum hallii]|uniref:probable uridine nucleosidase 2 isoform X2 n=2 Tax=Panicum hallii TaxID=206008 RepID=UPI000DF4D2E7|nr:probable uridine nucleosidase 2 isoform X2 [Panicum hallii]
MKVRERKKKVIIDTDPGIDDAMAILVALRSPELEVLGLTTTFGNVRTAVATRNALHLLETVGRTDIPVAEGSHVALKKDTKLRIASCCHGSDGLGNQGLPPATATKPVDQPAAAFLVEQANLYPGQVTVVALGPLTNLALALELDPSFPKKVGQVVVLGGAYSVNGNVNPAAESNMFGDPDAADRIFTCGADVLAVGINVTNQVILSDADREKLQQSDSKYARYLCKPLAHYFDYHREVYFTEGVYLHDPTALLAAVNPSLMTLAEGAVRVQTAGITKGLTLFRSNDKRYVEMTAWTGMPTVMVAVAVDAPAVVELMMQRLMSDDY